MYYLFSKRYSYYYRIYAFEARNKKELLIKILNSKEDYYVKFTTFFENISIISSDFFEHIFIWFGFEKIQLNVNGNHYLELKDNQNFMNFCLENFRIRGVYKTKKEMFRDIDFFVKMSDRSSENLLYQDYYFNPLSFIFQHSKNEENNQRFYDFENNPLFDKNVLGIINEYL